MKWCAVVALLSAFCSSATAWANGRFPRADQLVAVPGEPAELVLRTTFGLLVSHDAGVTWTRELSSERVTRIRAFDATHAWAFAADHVIGMKIPERDGPEEIAFESAGACDQLSELLTCSPVQRQAGSPAP